MKKSLLIALAFACFSCDGNWVWKHEYRILFPNGTISVLHTDDKYLPDDKVEVHGNLENQYIVNTLQDPENRIAIIMYEIK